MLISSEWQKFWWLVLLITCCLGGTETRLSLLVVYMYDNPKFIFNPTLRSTHYLTMFMKLNMTVIILFVLFHTVYINWFLIYSVFSDIVAVTRDMITEENEDEPVAEEEIPRVHRVSFSLCAFAGPARGPTSVISDMENHCSTALLDALILDAMCEHMCSQRNLHTTQNVIPTSHLLYWRWRIL